jgi:FdhD protein
MTEGLKRISIQRFENQEHKTIEDYVSVEEPLEISLIYGQPDTRQKRVVSVTMRTPGHDLELAIGFLYTEGIIKSVEDLVLEEQDFRRAPSNYIALQLRPELSLSLASLDRNFYTTSSCGVCGKTSIDAIKQQCDNQFEDIKPITPALLMQLPEKLRLVQTDFLLSGGIHASALFNLKGELITFREDVGRHNALDKLIGQYLLNPTTPLKEVVLLLSGRASFELVQKAAMAGISTIAAVGAPSSLAIETAKSFGINLYGFVKPHKFNKYH